MSTAETPASQPLDFVRTIVEEDLRTSKWGGRVHTRFPPEPNGYLHIGHAKSICLNFGLAQEYGGKCNLRFDDTNPTKEDRSTSIRSRKTSAGSASSGTTLYYASDYFEQLYDWAVQLIKKGKAYVCDLTADQVREYRGTLTTPGKNSPYRDRSVEENLDLFERMKAGEFPDGSRTLRAKIDMASPNLNLRDPVMYRILHAHASPHRRQVVHLPDVRLGPRAVAIRSSGSRTRSARWSSRTTGRCTTGSCDAAGHLPSAADRVRPAEPHLHGDEQAASCWSW